jgi:1,4-dihydroxy-2-naphthoate octaprenyltransferase
MNESQIELNRRTELAQQALWNGRVQISTGAVRKVVLSRVSPVNPEVLIFNEVVETGPSLTKKVFTATRAISLTATFTPALIVWMVGTWVLGWTGDAVKWWGIALALVFLQVAINIQNDVEDHLELVDQPGDIGGSGVIQKGWLTAREMSLLYKVFFVLGVAAALPVLLSDLQTMLPLAALSAVLALSYSGIGIRAKTKALGDVLVLILCGPLLTYGVAISAFNQFDSSLFWVGMVTGLGAVGILHANNLNDLEMDQTRGARTVANRIGFVRSQKYLMWIYVAIAAVLVGLAITGATPLWFCLAPLPAAIPISKMLKSVRAASGPLSPVISGIRFQAAQIHLLIGLLWMVGLVAWRVLRATQVVGF